MMRHRCDARSTRRSRVLSAPFTNTGSAAAESGRCGARAAERCAPGAGQRPGRLAPGGRLVIEDSAQLAEAADLAVFLESFASQMHEPYYRDYVQDDLAALVTEAGLRVGRVDRAWLAKVVDARRPRD